MASCCRTILTPGQFIRSGIELDDECMKSESDEITDDEFLLRRVHYTRFRTEKCPVISHSSFEPKLPGPKTRDPDVDGISLYRESCLNSPDDCLAKISDVKRSEWGVVRVPVHALKRIDLTVKPSPDDQIPGHVVIPEMSASEFENNRDFVRSSMARLAEICSQEGNVALTPPLHTSTTLKSVGS